MLARSLLRSSVMRSSPLRSVALPSATAITLRRHSSSMPAWWTNALTSLKSTIAISPWYISFLKIVPPVWCQVVYLAPLEAMRTIKKDNSTGNLPLMPYFTMAINGVIWTAYGLLVQQPSLWLGAAPGILFGAYYWGIFAKYAPKDFPMGTYYAGGAAGIVAIAAICATQDASTAANILGLAGNAGMIIMVGSPLMAIKTVIKEKSTRSLPIGLSTAVFINSALWTAYGAIVTHDPYIWVSNGVAFMFAAIQMGLFVRYGLPPKTPVKAPPKMV